MNSKEPERVCCMCESSSGEICSRTVTTDDREQVVYMHKHSGRCVEALKADKADLQQENQRLQEQMREERARAVEKFGDKYVGLGHDAKREAQSIREGRE